MDTPLPLPGSRVRGRNIFHVTKKVVLMRVAADGRSSEQLVDIEFNSRPRAIGQGTKERVLHVIASMGGGGAEAVLHNMWPALCHSSSYEFEICLLSSYGHFGTKLTSEGAT